MSDLPSFAEHLKKLARNYRETYLSLESRYQEIQSPEEFLFELKQREAALIDRFRLLQKEWFSVIKERELDRLLELSSIFDEVRVINQFIIQTVVEADKFATDKGQDSQKLTKKTGSGQNSEVGGQRSDVEGQKSDDRT